MTANISYIGMKGHAAAFMELVKSLQQTVFTGDNTAQHGSVARLHARNSKDNKMNDDHLNVYEFMACILLGVGLVLVYVIL